MMETGCILDKKTGKGVCPLQDVEVKAVIGDGLTEVVVVQNFINNTQEVIEALYTFPLPHRASVNGFKARVGKNEVTGRLKEKEEAFKEYDAAVRKGDSGFLLESHRPDIFQVSLGNILSGEKAVVTITYIQELEAVDDEIRWALPTVVAPRYIPGKERETKTGPCSVNPTDRVPDADYITPPIGDAPYTLKLDVNIMIPGGVEKISSPSHPIEISMKKDGNAAVSLGNTIELLDRDFILNISLPQENKNLLIIGKDENWGSFASIRFCPEIQCQVDLKVKYEYVFMIDVSGSMSGQKLNQAKSALGICLRNLMEGDLFNIVAFESGYDVFSNESVKYSQETLDRADKWIRQLESLGGTEIYEPMEFVLEDIKTKEGYEKILLLFTDGQVGNEEEVLRLVRAHRESLQLYSFGIDTAVNKYFIDGLAESGNGLAEYIYPGERIEDKVIRQFSRIHEPFISELSIKDIDGSDLEVVPDIPLRLHASETYSFTAALEDYKIPESVIVEGRFKDNPYSRTISVSGQVEGRILALKWAKEKIRSLEKLLGSGNGRREQLIKKDIINVSLKYGILSTLTSFVAVYKRPSKWGGIPKTVVVPVCLPEGWEPRGAKQSSNLLYSVISKVALRERHNVYYCIRSTSDSLDMPAFLQNSRSKRQEVTVNECRPASPIDFSEDWVDSENDEIVEMEDRLNNAFRRAAEIQNADGSFGTKENWIRKTALYVIGMLISKGDWKPYRIQIKKAGAALLKSDGSEALAECAALYLLIENNLSIGSDMDHRLNMLLGSMEALNKAVYEKFIAGDLSLLFKYLIPETAGNTGDNKEYAAALLEKSIREESLI